MNNLPAWQPPPNFIPQESALAGITVFAPRPENDLADTPQTFKCPQCGASTSFDVTVGGIACEHCGYTTNPQAKTVGLQAQVMEFTLETLSKAELGWGVARQEMHCNSCGADMAIPAKALSVTCPFCASNKVNVREAPADQLRPRFLIPFKIQPESTRTIAQKWLGQGWFHPDELGTSAMLERFAGIYLPFWTFSAKIKSDWKAQVGYETQESYYDDNDKSWKTRTRIDWRWENGQVKVDISNVLVSGSSHISEKLIEQIQPFELQGLVNYAPDFLAGWQAHTYDLTLPKAWELSKTEMREQAKDACHKVIKSPHVRSFNMTADFAEETWRYILLPVYITAYKFENKVYQVMINGQTGAIAGQKPVAWWKIWLGVAAMLSPGFCLGLIGLPLLLAGGIGVLPLFLGLIFFILGMVGAFALYRKALTSEAL